MKSLSFVLVLLAACAGGHEGAEDTTTPTKTGTAKPTAGGDVSIDIPATPINGVVLEPEALGRPGMPLAHPKKPTTVDKERAAIPKEKDPIVKQAHAAILATLLYEQAKNSKDGEKQLWTDARQTLRDVIGQVGEKNVDETALRMLAAYEIFLEDWPAAETLWKQLLDKDPKAKDTPETRAWWAYALLKQFKNADALAAIKDQKIEEKQPELAYVAAWAKWRGGDDAGAWQAIITAAKGWGSNANVEVVQDDTLLFAGRTNVALEAALPELQKIFGKTPLQQYDMLAKLGLKAYGFSGRWQDGVSALDKAVAIGGAAIPPQHLPVVRYSQADFTVRLDAPDVATKYAKQSLDALPACGAACNQKDKNDTITGVYIMGRLFHILYATANDRRYYQPAHDCYSMTIPLMTDPTLAAQKTEAEKDFKILEQTFKNMKVGTGTHDKGALGALLSRHNQEVQACYENGLATNPKLGGTITLTLESDQTGAVKGVTTEPKAGQADLPMIAKCVADHANTWKLPQRGMAGHTRIKMTFQLALRKQAPAASATQTGSGAQTGAKSKR